MSLIEQMHQVRDRAEEAVAAAQTEQDLQEVRSRFLGRKGEVTRFLQRLGGLPPEERPAAGKAINELKQDLTRLLDERIGALRSARQEAELARAPLDLSLPGRAPQRGASHPLTQTMHEVAEIFLGLGFDLVEGPEVETDYYNFEALNIPKDHPARDMQDTFYVSDDIVLRTHTSPVQIRTMERQQPPVSIVSLGRVYRCDADVRHSPMFHQCEGLRVDRGVSMADLKGVLEAFARQFFGRSLAVRFRPSFFPFTEPSAEMDIACVFCEGRGCRVCGQSGWLEILGSGMVDPEVYRFVGYDSQQWSGFAFGMGMERLAMLKHGINNVSLFFENDLRFLEQFV